MLSRDYISRIIRTFSEALEDIFDGRREKEGEVEKKLDLLYKTYFEKTREVFLTESPEEMVRYWENDPNYLEKCGMLAEVMYREVRNTEDKDLQKNLSDKVIFLYRLIDKRSSDYSLLYANRILELEREFR